MYYVLRGKVIKYLEPLWIPEGNVIGTLSNTFEEHSFENCQMYTLLVKKSHLELLRGSSGHPRTSEEPSY